MTTARAAWTLLGAVALGLTLTAARTTPLRAAMPPHAGQDVREVRHLVTFRFLPGQTDTVLSLYGQQLLPIYREVDAMRRVRLLREAESPEPLDLMVVTHYESLAAMDRANQALSRPVPDRASVGQLYRQIADASLGHTDQIVELITAPAPATLEPQIEILEFLRLAPGMGPVFERTVASLQAWEQEQAIRDLLLRSDTARVLVGDGWDYLRTYAVRDLAAWQTYSSARLKHGVPVATSRLVEARKTLMLRELAGLRVR